MDECGSSTWVGGESKCRLMSREWFKPSNPNQGMEEYPNGKTTLRYCSEKN